MPFYEFRCSECQHTFETLVPTMSVPADLRCPRCGAAGPRRLLSNFFAHSAQKPGAMPEACRQCPGSGGAQCPLQGEA